MNKPIGKLAAAAALMAALAAPAFADAPPSILRGLDALAIGEPLSREALTVIPLLSPQALEPVRCLTLEQALERGWLSIEEKDGGTVPEVWITNRSDRSIFIMGGEILSGARQDRIVRGDVLVSPYRKRLAVPVFCVEEGRWHYTSKSFGSEKNLGTWKLRSKAQSGRAEAQAEIWGEVARANEAMGVAAPTGAYQDAYRDRKVQLRIRDLEEALADLPRRHPDAVGVIVGLGDRIVSMDLFASPSLFQELWPKLLKSAVLSLLEEQGKARLPRRQAAAMLQDLRRAGYDALEALDMGIEYRSDGERWSVQALAHRDALLHLNALAQEP